MDKVSVVIPTYNRFKYLLNTIESIKLQTYPNIEIIIVNDASTQKEYYDFDWASKQVKIIHLAKNSREIFGYACAGYVRNKGIEASSGKYVAFCDDDDLWFPHKIEKQLKLMKETGCMMSSTEGLNGTGIFNPRKSYKKYISESNYSTLQEIYKRKGSHLLDNGIPAIWNLGFIKVHNCIVCSSVILEKRLLDKINGFRNIQNACEDYDCWLRALQYTDSAYVDDVCFYYDNGHGDGQNY